MIEKTFSTNSGLYNDFDIVKCKSENFPTIASTTWIGTTTDWNEPVNGTNSVPTSQLE